MNRVHFTAVKNQADKIRVIILIPHLMMFYKICFLRFPSKKLDITSNYDGVYSFSCLLTFGILGCIRARICHKLSHFGYIS